MGEILFSVIIPHYNIPMCLKRLLDSIPDVSDLEVIVVDDKSDARLDELNNVIKQYSGQNRFFYSNETDKKGAGVCRNIGIEHARGKWLLFADSDDFFHADLYEVISSCVEKEEDIIFFPPTSVDIDTGKMSDRHLEFCDAINNYMNNQSEYNELILRYQVVAPWSKLIKRKMIVENNISFEDTKVANDVLFCRKIGYYAKKITVDPRVIYTVSERSGSLTKLLDKNSYYTRLNVFVRSTEFVRKNAGNDVLKKMNFNGSYFLHMCKVNNFGIFTMINTAYILIKGRIRPI